MYRLSYTISSSAMGAHAAIWDIERPAELAYRIGANPCRGVVRAGVAH